MSLLSLLSNSTSSASSAYGSSSVSAVVEAALARSKAADAASSSTTSSTSISNAAAVAAADKADNSKDFSTVTSETRAALDAQYKAGASKADLSKLSGRAVASIALNKDGNFSASEVAQAHSELKTREKSALTSALMNGVSIDSIAAYGKSFTTSYDAMSQEEREAHGWTAQTRASFAAMADTSKINSLFDALRSEG